MAIDTQNKRRSIVYVLPVPDSSIGQADRQQAVWIYAGILASAVVVSPKLDVDGTLALVTIQTTTNVVVTNVSTGTATR